MQNDIIRGRLSAPIFFVDPHLLTCLDTSYWNNLFWRAVYRSAPITLMRSVHPCRCPDKNTSRKKTRRNKPSCSNVSL